MAKRKCEVGDIVVVKKTGLRGKIVGYNPGYKLYGEIVKSTYVLDTKYGNYGNYGYYSNELDNISGVKTVYLASGWFDSEQERTRLNVLNILKEFPELNIFSPKDEVICPADASQDFAEAVYKGNVDAIHRSLFTIVNTTSKDLGTIHESGIASEAGVPIIYYAELPKGAKFNLMLARSGVAVATNPNELHEVIQHFKDNNWDFTKKIPYTGNIE